MSFGTAAASYVESGEILASLIAAYNFEEGAGVTTADVSNNGHDLTIGPYGSYVTGHSSNFAVQGDVDNKQGELGAGAYGTFPGGSPGSGPFSACFWAQIPDAGGAVCVSAFNTVASRGDPWAISVEDDGSVQAFWYGDTDTLNSAAVSMTTGVVTANIWVHIAGVFMPGNGVTLYANGVVVTTYSWQGGSSAFYDTWETLLIGSSRWGSAGGIVDDLRICGEALTETQIMTLMNQPV